MRPFYHPRIFERVNIALLDMFNSIELNRYDADFNVEKIIRVPIVFYYDKSIAEFVMNTTSTKKESKHSAPILGLRLNSMAPNQSSKTQINRVRKIYDSASATYTLDVAPAPWVLNYSLSLYAEKAQDFFQLIEQIVPYYNGQLSLRIKEFEFNNIERDIPVNLTNVDLQFAEGEREKHNSMTAIFSFSVKVDFYQPPMIADVIKQIEMNINVDGSPSTKITNVGIKNMNIEDYNKALNEIVEVGKIPHSIVVSKAEPKSDSEYSVVLTANRDNQSSYSFITLPAGKIITYVEVFVTEKFNDLNATLSVGTTLSPNLIMSTTDNNLYVNTLYSMMTNVRLQTNTDIMIFYNQGDSTTGVAEIRIKYK